MRLDLYSQPHGERRLHRLVRPLDRHAESWLQPADIKCPLRIQEAPFYKLHIEGGRTKGKRTAYGYQEPFETGDASATVPAKGDPRSTRSMVRRFVSAEEKTSAR
jgi:hypothetical protein